MNQLRVISFIDGFNLYHAIDKLDQPHLKWLDLRSLSLVFICPQSQSLDGVYYFSAYADWLPQSKKRHIQYIYDAGGNIVATCPSEYVLPQIISRP
jgi:hypothetical protein